MRAIVCLLFFLFTCVGIAKPFGISAREQASVILEWGEPTALNLDNQLTIVLRSSCSLPIGHYKLSVQFNSHLLELLKADAFEYESVQNEVTVTGDGHIYIEAQADAEGRIPAGENDLLSLRFKVLQTGESSLILAESAFESTERTPLPSSQAITATISVSPEQLEDTKDARKEQNFRDQYSQSDAPIGVDDLPDTLPSGFAAAITPQYESDAKQAADIAARDSAANAVAAQQIRKEKSAARRLFLIKISLGGLLLILCLIGILLLCSNKQKSKTFAETNKDGEKQTNPQETNNEVNS